MFALFLLKYTVLIKYCKQFTPFRNQRKVFSFIILELSVFMKQMLNKVGFLFLFLGSGP